MGIELKVNAVSGSKAGKVELSDGNFGAAFNEPLVHQVVVAYQAGGRSGMDDARPEAVARRRLLQVVCSQ